MHAYSSAQGLCRFQSTLRPSVYCQCSTSFVARPTNTCTAIPSTAVLSSNTGSSSISSDQASSPVDVSQQILPQPLQAAAGSPTRQRKQRRSQQAWDYKYKWTPCPSPCEANDDRCRKVEALIQNVLSYPIMPIHICKYLPRSSADLNSMTALVEQMASHFGKELTLVYITKTPRILDQNFSTVLERIKAFRELFGVLDSDVPMMLRKYSGLLTLEAQEVRLRFDNLRELTGFNNQQVGQGQHSRRGTLDAAAASSD